jgi:hypothetical protein
MNDLTAGQLSTVESSNVKGRLFMRWKYFLAWLPGVPIAIANGSIRQFVYRSYLDELPAHQLSAVSFILLFGLYVWFIIPWLKLTAKADALRLGSLWLLLTIGFEFIFGHFVMGNPWPLLLHDYNIFAGRLWVVVLIWTAVAPFVLYQVRISIKAPQA